MSEEKIQINYKQIEEQIDKYLREHNVASLISILQYVLSHYKIYLNIDINDIVLAYRDYLFSGVLVTFVLRTGVGIKVKVSCDRDHEKITGADVWFVTE